MLNGSLDVFALPDVLHFVASSGITGRIEITRDEIGGEFSIDRGKFVAARLAEDDAPTTVDEALDVCVLLMDGTGGSFQVVEEEWVGGPLDLNADALTKAVQRRREEWAALVAELGSLEDALSLVPHLPDGVTSVQISADQWKLLALVDGQRSVQDIARDSASSVYSAARALAEMAKLGLVARGGGWRDAEEAAEAPTPVPRKRGKASATVVEDDDPAELLRELGEDDEEPAPAGEPVTAGAVRPLRAPTREEQRLRLRR